MVSRSAWLLAWSAPLAAYAQDQHAYIQSTRGVQHKPPLISDDFVVGCIMIMFLLLFAFGERAAAAASTLHNTTSFDELTAIHAFYFCCSQASNDPARPSSVRLLWGVSRVIARAFYYIKPLFFVKHTFH